MWLCTVPCRVSSRVPPLPHFHRYLFSGLVLNLFLEQSTYSGKGFAFMKLELGRDIWDSEVKQDWDNQMSSGIWIPE